MCTDDSDQPSRVAARGEPARTVGQHSKTSWTRQRWILASATGLVLVVLVGFGVREATTLAGDVDAPSGKDAPSRATEDQRRAPKVSDADPDAKAPFPGRPAKKEGVSQSGLSSGLGQDADDLAARAQDLIDADSTTAPPAPPLSFRVSTFNVLGAGHTGARGNKPGWADYGRRMTTQVAMLRRHDVDVVGFQEFEAPQFHSFMRRTGGRWGVYPALSKGRNAVRNSIAWQRSVWDLADYSTIPVPYFRGNIVPMPVILLTHKQSRRQVYLINVHNPASSSRRGNNERWRDEATRRQLAKVRALRQKAPKVPVILMGDFNERLEVYCRVTGSGGMQAANPGDDSGGCSPPPMMGIDWIFGTRDLVFSDYLRQDVGGASDHPMIVAAARLE